MKLVFFYMILDCDHAGIWQINLEYLSIFVGTNITLDNILKELGEQIEPIDGDTLWLKKFTLFQYGELNSRNKVHNSVLSLLSDKGLASPLQGPSQGPKDKDKDKYKEKDKDKVKVKDKVQDKEKEKVKEKERASVMPEIDCVIEDSYFVYPRKEGKAKGIANLKKQIDKLDDFKLFHESVRNYKEHIDLTGQYTKHFSTFVGSKAAPEWRDWLDHDCKKFNCMLSSNFDADTLRAKKQWEDIQSGKL